MVGVYFSATQPGTKNVLLIPYSSSMFSSSGTPTFDSKRPIESPMGSSEPRCTQTTSASRSNVNRHAHLLPFGHGRTTGFNSLTCDGLPRFGLTDLVGLRMSAPSVPRPEMAGFHLSIFVLQDTVEVDFCLDHLIGLEQLIERLPFRAVETTRRNAPARRSWEHFLPLLRFDIRLQLRGRLAPGYPRPHPGAGPRSPSL